MVGAILGSFLATIALRWPAGRSSLHGRSACDGCGRTLGPRDLVPLLSWIVRKGRCRRCGARIHPLHPAMEGMCAAIGAAALWLSPGPDGLALALLGWLALLAGVLDARHFWLPHRLSLVLAALGLAAGGAAMRAVGLDVALFDRAAAATLAYAALTLLALAYRALRGREGLGGGDAPFLGALAAWTGWQLLPLLLLFAGLAGIAVALGNRLRPDRALPLGTLLVLALPFALATGGALLAMP